MFKKLFELYKKYEEILNYLIFGVLSTLVSILSYALFTRVFDINYVISNILSWILAVTFAFITNKFFVFKAKDNKSIKELIKFYLSRVTTLLIEIFIMFIMVDILNLNDMICKIIAQVVVIILNYVFSKLFVFNKKESVLV